MKQGLFARSLILLAVPIAVQLISITWFAGKFMEVRQGLRYQLTAMRCSAQASRVLELMMLLAHNGYQAKSLHDRTRDSMAYADTMNTLQDLQDATFELRETGAPYKDLIDCTHHMSEVIKKQWNSLQADAYDAKLIENKDWLNQLRDFDKKILTEMEWLNARPATSSALQQLTNSDGLHKAILLAVAINIAVNVLTAAVFWLVIKKSVVGQVNRVETNFARLSRNEELLPVLEGDDEVASFDRAFHDVVREVVEVRNQRKEYLTIMSSIMRKPLVELSAFFEKVGKNEFGELNGKGDRVLNMSSQAIKRLVVMLNELIDFAQIEQGTLALNWTRSKARLIVNDAVECIQARADQSKIGIVIQVDDVEINADSDRLVQVLMNLITNAIKFSPPKTSIDVAMNEDENGYLFTVQDQGRGIPRDMLDKIFQKFEQVDQLADSKKQTGTGLGLAICKTIVEAHGGGIWAETPEEGGARFCFRIPRVELVTPVPPAE